MMNSFLDKMGEKLMPFASKISTNRYLNAIKEGFFGVMPVIIVGSLFLLFTSIIQKCWLFANYLVSK